MGLAVESDECKHIARKSFKIFMARDTRPELMILAMAKEEEKKNKVETV